MTNSWDRSPHLGVESPSLLSLPFIAAEKGLAVSIYLQWWDVPGHVRLPSPTALLAP